MPIFECLNVEIFFKINFNKIIENPINKNVLMASQIKE